MLEPTHLSIMAAVRSKIETDCPPLICVGLDGWSKFHQGYMGINSHYINDNWAREIICLACPPFNESHTGENIYKCLKSVLLEWGILDKVRAGLCLRDNASNMESAFKADAPWNVDHLESLGCLNHSLQVRIIRLSSNLSIVRCKIHYGPNWGHFNLFIFFCLQARHQGWTVCSSKCGESHKESQGSRRICKSF